MSVIMRNDIEVGGTDDGIIAKVGTDTLDTTAQDLSGAINEHEEDISQLNSSLAKLKYVSTNLPSSTGTHVIKTDSTLLNNYIIIGYMIDYGGSYWIWNGTGEISEIKITSSGIEVKLVSSTIAGRPIKLLLYKIA